jgi:hypothetical protein
MIDAPAVSWTCPPPNVCTPAPGPAGHNLNLNSSPSHQRSSCCSRPVSVAALQHAHRRLRTAAPYAVLPSIVTTLHRPAPPRPVWLNAIARGHADRHLNIAAVIVVFSSGYGRLGTATWRPCWRQACRSSQERPKIAVPCHHSRRGEEGENERCQPCVRDLWDLRHGACAILPNHTLVIIIVLICVAGITDEAVLCVCPRGWHLSSRSKTDVNVLCSHPVARDAKHRCFGPLVPDIPQPTLK